MSCLQGYVQKKNCQSKDIYSTLFGLETFLLLVFYLVVFEITIKKPINNFVVIFS